MRRGSTGPARLRVFISYSRRDLEFVDRLQAALMDRGIEASVDREAIEKGEAWWTRIQQLITEADTVVFVLSPESASSPVCKQEVDFAESLNKRFIPVVARDITGHAAPPALARLNYVFFVPHAGALGDFDAAVGELKRALETDIPWIREHTRLGTLAQRWETRKRPQELLLRGGELAAAETWLTSRPRNAPDPTDAHRALVTESRKAATHRQRRTLALSFLAVAVSLSLAALAYFKQLEAQQTLATSDFINGTRLFLDPATTHDGLRLLARAASLEDRERALIRLAGAAQHNRFWITAPAPAKTPAAKAPVLPPQFSQFSIDGKKFKTISHAASNDGQRIAVSASDGDSHPDIRVRVFDSGRAITDWFVPKDEGEQWLFNVRVILSPDGRFLATERMDWRSASYIQIHDLSRKKPIGTPIFAAGTISAYQHRGFRVVKFFDGNSFGYSDKEQRYLLVGSERGNAAVYYIEETGSRLLFKHQHGEVVVTAAIGGTKGNEILASFDAAFTGKVSGINGNTARHPDIQTEFAPQRIAIAADGSDISLYGANGETAQFRLIRPSKNNPVLGGTARSDTTRAAVARSRKPFCQLSEKNGHPVNDEISKRAATFFAGRDRKLVLEGRRLTIRDTKGATIASRDYPWPIVGACATHYSDALTIAFDNLDVEVWRGDLSAQIGARIKQLSYFKGGQRPDRFISGQLSKDERKVLIVTHFWNPPNLGFYWISLYDTATGLPLLENLSFVDEDTNFGILSDDGTHIALGAGHFETNFKPISEMRLLPAPDAKARLIAHMTRIAKRLPSQGSAK